MAETTIGCVAAVEYGQDSDRYVLIEETKSHKKGRLNLPGGEIEILKKRSGGFKAQEGLLACVSREIEEESGLKPDDVELRHFLGLFQYTRDSHMHLAFGALATGGELGAENKKKHPHVEAYSYEDIEELHAAGHLRSDRVIEVIRRAHGQTHGPARERVNFPSVAEFVSIFESDVLPRPQA